jgi:hypothetical protein
VSYIYVQLRGGLGNQLFQYAAARSIAIAQGAELVVDKRTGFALDRVYKRKFALRSFPISGCTASFWHTFIFILKWSFFKLPKSFFRVAAAKFSKGVIYENEPTFQDYLISQNLNQNLWLVGYWQSPKYFEQEKRLLLNELMPPTPEKNKPVMDLGRRIQACDAVAVGVRLYEESANPADHASSGKVKSIEKINQQVQQLRRDRPNAKFFVFCTYKATELYSIDFPNDTYFVTGSNGFDNPVESLWLLSRCKHHIFNNSSFYWWGAWLSEAVHPNTEQLIYAADNFINADGLCDHWHRF